MENVQKALNSKIQTLQQSLTARTDLELITDTERTRRSGILTFRHRKIEPELLFNKLKEQGVVCACRGGGIRFSPHFYTPDAVLNHAVELIPTR